MDDSSRNGRDVMRSQFTSTLNYSSVNEDWRTEAAALRINESDRVACITGSGDRPLDLLVLDPAEVHAIDFNPAQTHLLALKAAAIRRLSYDDFVTFIGLTHGDGKSRSDTWRRLRREVPEACRAFWDERRPLLQKGVLYQGRWERFFRRAALAARMLHKRAIQTLFEVESIEEQRAFVQTLWDRPGWRFLFAATCHPLTARYLLGDPAFYAHVAVPPAPLLAGRMRASLERVLARENFMVSLLLRGRLSPLDLPPYLTPAGHATIRERLDRLTAVTANVIDYLAARPHGTFTRYSLSDVPSYLPADDFARLLDGVVRSASPGARFVIRQFLTRYALPERFEPLVAREPELERTLAADDRSFAYEFLVGEVRHA